MSPNRVRTATAASGVALMLAVAAAGPAWAMWPMAAAKPKAETSAKPATADTTAKPAAPRKATAAERAMAARLDPLARAAFWAHETDTDPTDSQAALGLSAALRALGKYEEAVQASARVLVLEPKNIDGYLETARAHLGAGKGFYALAPLRQAQALSPHDWRATSLLGVAYDQTHRPADAVAAFNQALALSPNNPAILSNLALSYAGQGRAAEAEGLLRRAVAAPGATAQERQNLALVLGLEGKLAEAERLIRDDLPPELADGNVAYIQATASARRSWQGVQAAGGAQK